MTTDAVEPPVEEVEVEATIDSAMAEYEAMFAEAPAEPAAVAPEEEAEEEEEASEDAPVPEPTDEVEDEAEEAEETLETPEEPEADEQEKLLLDLKFRGDESEIDLRAVMADEAKREDLRRSIQLGMQADKLKTEREAARTEAQQLTEVLREVASGKRQVEIGPNGQFQWAANAPAQAAPTPEPSADPLDAEVLAISEKIDAQSATTADWMRLSEVQAEIKVRKILSAQEASQAAAQKEVDHEQAFVRADQDLANTINAHKAKFIHPRTGEVDEGLFNRTYALARSAVRKTGDLNGAKSWIEKFAGEHHADATQTRQALAASEKTAKAARKPRRKKAPPVLSGNTSPATTGNGQKEPETIEEAGRAFDALMRGE